MNGDPRDREVSDASARAATTSLDAVDGRTYGGDGFRFEYRPGTIRCGRNCVDALAEELRNVGGTRALVVTGRTVGQTAAVMDPVREGLEDAFEGTFAETTPDKRLGTAHAAAEAFAEHDADAFVAVGGGSSLDVVTVARALVASGQSHEAAAADLADTGTIPVPDGDLPSAVAVPTTLAGADLAQGAGITAAPDTDPVDESIGGGVSDPRLMPSALFYDPALFATTPASVRAASAMNGLDKAVESLYARNATPISDATAVHGLRLCRRGFSALADDDADPRELEQAVLGVLLAQYGVSRPDGSTLSVLHAFGHGLTNAGDVHQGRAHAAVAPHVLRFVFERVDGRRDLLADALAPHGSGATGSETGESDDDASAAVAGLAALRDDLGLPQRIRDLEDPPACDELDDVAADVLGDGFMENAPSGLDATVEDLREVLEAAW
ncbi:iron-containing alcohol dehydrogenase family protein [Halobacterium zhouii]|uniref:iron-containing alcohol dehydrogenase family protein n=1 Tax=Halobacterium zhouii TaxID=2902624 RepID=UPI001E41FEBF|nr:iron-containing alcohol dehydrogenase family protein [Halobacterium zhouii]